MVGWFNPGTTINPTNDPNMPSPDPAGVQQFNNQGAYLSNLMSLLGGGVPQGGGTTQGAPNPLANTFQTLFGGGQRRRRGGQGGMGGGGGGGAATALGPPPAGITPRVWAASGGSLDNALQRMQFEAANGGYTGWGPVGSAAPGFSVNNNLQWNEPILDHGTMAPPGAPRFASAAGMVNANSYNPLSGFAEDAMLWDPTGMSGTGRFQPTQQQLQNQRNWANVPWQTSWADPSASNFYMTAQNLGATPSSYLNPGQWSWGGGQALDNTTGGRPPNAQPGYAPGGYGPLADAQYNQNGGGGWQGGMTGGPHGAPGGAQGGTPPPYPPGGNGPTGPAQPPAAPAGNFQMYPGMPYAGGMGPYSGWLPPAPGTQTDYGGPGQASSPLDAIQRQQAAAAQPGGPNSGWLPPAPGTQTDWGGPGQYASPMEAAAAQYGTAPAGLAPQPTVGLAGGEYANLGMPNWNSAPSFAGGGGPWG